jgi:hypothetical protein
MAWIYLKSLTFYFIAIQVVQEYERAVIFRLGRLPSGGAKGPGKKEGYMFTLNNTELYQSVNRTYMYIVHQ